MGDSSGKNSFLPTIWPRVQFLDLQQRGVWVELCLIDSHKPPLQFENIPTPSGYNRQQIPDALQTYMRKYISPLRPVFLLCTKMVSHQSCLVTSLSRCCEAPSTISTHNRASEMISLHKLISASHRSQREKNKYHLLLSLCRALWHILRAKMENLAR